MGESNGAASKSATAGRRYGPVDGIVLVLVASYVAYLLNSFAVRTFLSEFARLYSKFVS